MTDDAPPLDDRPWDERFYVGTIRKLFLGSRSGIVRSQNGREIAFVWLHVERRGHLRHFEDLREGMPVGFDVGWTSKGLRVTALHVG